MIYSVFEEWPDQQWEEENNISLFSRKAYWDLQITESKNVNDIAPILIKNELNEIIAYWCFALTNSEWISPYNAPFFEPFIGNSAKLPEILSLIIEYLKEKKNSSIEITLPLHFHVLANVDFKELLSIASIKNIAVGNLLQIKASKSFGENIAQKRKRRKLKSLLKEDFKISEAKQDEWEILYNKIIEWRKLKGHQNLMSKELMLLSKAKFPNFYRCLHLEINAQTAGLVFFVQINAGSFYIYSLIIDPQLKEQHASLLLWNALYNLAKKEKISQFDLGTSMLPNNKINKRLLRFKLSLGAKPTKKYTLVC